MMTCGPCTQLLADAKRGHAWLEMLRDPLPEAPEALLEKILAQTSGMAPAVVPGAAVVGTRTVVVPFRERFWAALRRNSIGQIALQPRLAMTAAMSFFSIALTMNLTGMQLKDLNPSNLRPSNIKRTYVAAKVRTVRYYEGLRVVYELESRVHQMESVGADETTTPAPQSAPARQQNNQPADEKSTPEKKGSSSHPSPSGPMHYDRPGGRMSLARYVPGQKEIAELNRVMWELNSGKSTCGTGIPGTVREGRLV
jgi:hypothetical protein